ncbi:FAD/NAD(P)-binding protein [Streptomyces sp. NPDC026092]|uniref:FAD/NAD(P)-binding protein n=1 Tax=Streptomyces sp. NPDC026092 TaxID=3154797 RepID=UPI0034021C96
MARSLVIVGAGPRGTGVLERIAANVPELYDGSGLDVHVVDPYPPGGGRIWRHDQSPLLRMNSQARDVTMFTDDSVEMAGPVLAGPTVHAWAGGDGRAFVSRRTHSGYLRWVYERAVAALPPGIAVHHHPRRALRVAGARHGRQTVRLEGLDAPLAADAVVLAQGHLDAEPDAEQIRLADFAARHGLVHLPPEFTADSDLSPARLPPGAPVLVRGLGLAFVDLMVLLTEGRGGRYEDGAYVPSGRESVLYVGSRRGVPYHAKIAYSLVGERPPLPRHLGPAEIDRLLALPGGADFRRDVWPLVAKELGFAHYHRLFTAHPERTRVPWAEFERAHAVCPPGGGPELDALVASAVPDPADRLDLGALDRPLAGVRHASAAALQEHLRTYISADLARRRDPERSADLALSHALLAVYGQLARLGDLGPWWHGFYSSLASGPPDPRLRNLLALSRAGVVRFLGADLRIAAGDGVFRAHSPTLPGHVTEARALVEARLPEPTVTTTRDPLLRALYADGAAATPAGLLAVDPADGRVLDRTGVPHPRRFALGPHTDARGPGGFTRPGGNGLALRQNDATARAVLALLRDLTGPRRA